MLYYSEENKHFKLNNTQYREQFVQPYDKVA